MRNKTGVDNMIRKEYALTDRQTDIHTDIQRENQALNY